MVVVIIAPIVVFAPIVVLAPFFVFAPFVIIAAVPATFHYLLNIPILNLRNAGGRTARGHHRCRLSTAEAEQAGHQRSRCHSKGLVSHVHNSSSRGDLTHNAHRQAFVPSEGSRTADRRTAFAHLDRMPPEPRTYI